MNICCLLILICSRTWLSFVIEHPVVAGMDPLSACHLHEIAQRIYPILELTYVFRIGLASWRKESVRHFYGRVSIVCCQNAAVLQLFSNRSFEEIVRLSDGIDDFFKFSFSEAG